MSPHDTPLLSASRVGRYPLPALLLLILLLWTASCSESVEHMASAVNDKDSLPFMHATGVNTRISDSGVIKYRMVTEQWDIYNAQTGTPATWKFLKGLLMERYDKNFHIDMHVQADTAYLHRQYLWELRGHVVVRNQQNDRFLTDELFWDLNTHEMWNHQYMRIITPTRELEGTEFRSNETMTRYSVANSIGAFPVSDAECGEESETTSDTP